MATINGNNNLGGLESLLNQATNTTQTSDESGSQALDQSDFLKLLTTQMNYQNPMEPMDNTEMAAQMAQFSSVQGIGELNQSFKTLSNSMQSNSALQASMLVGKSVAIESNSFNYNGQPVKLRTEAPFDGNINITIKNINGETIKEDSIYAKGNETTNYTWDGTNLQNIAATNGEYIFEFSVGEGEDRQILTNEVIDKVNSVNIPKLGEELVLNLENTGKFSQQYIKEIME